jgi:hypothetical protein
MKKKQRKYKVDEWALYCQFADSDSELLREHKIRALILEVFGKQKYQIYDYRIFLDDGSGIIRKVKEESLFPYEKTK